MASDRLRPHLWRQVKHSTRDRKKQRKRQPTFNASSAETRKAVWVEKKRKDHCFTFLLVPQGVCSSPPPPADPFLAASMGAVRLAGACLRQAKTGVRLYPAAFFVHI